jgi:hypothetical protein
MTDLHQLDWALLDHTAREPVRVGDLISADAGGMPIYHVTACEPGRAWVAAAPGAPARAMSLDGFRWRGVSPASPAAARGR